ncbi:MAG: UMP kinase [Halobacteriaceae archaeon]
MRVVVSIGGSVLAPELEPDRVNKYADVIENIVAEGWTVGVVVGGGTIAREYIDVARRLGANEIELDEIGIEATRLNARLLISALGPDISSTPATTYEQASEAMRHDDITVMGGVAPGQTTDAVSAALAEYTDADLLVYSTSVQGVYNADPNTDETATRFDILTPSELVDVIAGIEMSAGSSSPVDLLAGKLIERSRVRTIVLDGTDPSRVLDAVLKGEHDGTDIVPEGGQQTIEYWPKTNTS